MEQQQQAQGDNEENNSGGGGSKGGFGCRQSSTRWTPTSEQIRILKDLYYNCGVRSPNAEQIQRISSRLRQYGKIEGKNVFYWFQNHKARERQKKRFSSSDLPHHQQLSSSTWKPDPNHFKYPTINSISSGFSSAASSSAAAGFSTLGQIYGSVTMEKSFRNCSISSSNSHEVVGGSMSQSYGWVGIDPYNSFFEKQKSTNEALEDEDQEEEDNDDEEEKSGEIETLPLFPTQREDINGFCNIKHNPMCYSYNWFASEDPNTASPTSLELTLSSYGINNSNNNNN